MNDELIAKGVPRLLQAGDEVKFGETRFQIQVWILNARSIARSRRPA